MAVFMVVEDDPAIRHILGQYVAQSGHQALEAEGGDAAWELLAQRPAGVFLDIDLRGETGVDFLFRLRRHGDQGVASLPVYFCTAYPERGIPMQGSGRGALGVIKKPFRRAEIQAAIGAMLAGQER